MPENLQRLEKLSEAEKNVQSVNSYMTSVGESFLMLEKFPVAGKNFLFILFFGKKSRKWP